GRRLRADHGTPVREAGRHRSHRRHRPVGQHGLDDAIRWLAAVVTDRARAWLRPEFARADVLAETRPADIACARQAAAHDPYSIARTSRRTPHPCLWHSGW